jgi:predicted transglutaminase-like cysteine proteinase
MPCKCDLPCRHAKTDRHKCGGRWANRPDTCGPDQQSCGPPISPVSDEMQWGVADHWSDPFETLLSNRGDCEDYAILKYAALLEAGIPEDDVKIVILKNFFPNENHAAVALASMVSG